MVPLPEDEQVPSNTVLVIPVTMMHLIQGGVTCRDKAWLYFHALLICSVGHGRQAQKPVEVHLLASKSEQEIKATPLAPVWPRSPALAVANQKQILLSLLSMPTHTTNTNKTHLRISSVPHPPPLQASLDDKVHSVRLPVCITGRSRNLASLATPNPVPDPVKAVVWKPKNWDDV